MPCDLLIVGGEGDRALCALHTTLYALPVCGCLPVIVLFARDGRSWREEG